MIQQAIDNLRQAAAGEKTGSLKDYIAKRLTEQAIKTDEDAAKILAEGKSLGGCCEAVRKSAKEMVVDGCACVDEDTVYSWALDYYGLSTPEAGASRQEQTPAPASATGELHVDLLDLL